jgi:methyl-accepting chemotaxis protein
MTSESRRQESVVEETAESIEEMGASINSVNEHVSRLEGSARETAGSVLEMDASIGEVADHMDDLAGAIDVTSSSISQLTASIRGVSDSMGGLERATDTTSTSLQDLHASVALIEGNAEKCHDLTQNAAQEAEQGCQSVEQTITAMHEISASFGGLQDIIGELAHKSESIGEIVQVIESVAEETSLLQEPRRANCPLDPRDRLPDYERSGRNEQGGGLRAGERRAGGEGRWALEPGRPGSAPDHGQRRSVSAHGA